MPIKAKTSLENAQRHERDVAKRLGGRVTTGSGNKTEKGDVRVAGKFRVENKSTIHQSYGLARATLRKIEAAAVMAGEEPAMHLRFLDGDRVADEWVVVRPWVLERLCR